jgi:hypothetical protein
MALYQGTTPERHTNSHLRWMAEPAFPQRRLSQHFSAGKAQKEARVPEERRRVSGHGPALSKAPKGAELNGYRKRSEPIPNVSPGGSFPCDGCPTLVTAEVGPERGREAPTSKGATGWDHTPLFGHNKFSLSSAIPIAVYDAPSTSPSASTSSGGSYVFPFSGRHTIRRTRSYRGNGSPPQP